MKSSRLFIGAIIVLTICTIYELSILEVDNKKFGITRSLQIDARADRFFQFLLHEDNLEQLLPWLTRFKEADTRILSVGKFYRAFCKLPVFGTSGIIYLIVVDYRPGSLLVLESNDSLMEQRIEILVENRENRTTLRSSIYLRKTSAIYHYTIGLLLRYKIARYLEKSSFRVAEIYKNIVQCMRLLTDC